MLLQEDIQVKKDYVFLKFSGIYSGLEGVPELMRTVVGLAISNSLKNILIDLTEVKGKLPGSDAFELGELAAKIWGYNLKIAIIYRPADITGMFENVAVNRGGNVRVISTVEEGEKWLLHE